MMMHVMVAAKHDPSAYFLSSAAVKPHCFCRSTEHGRQPITARIRASGRSRSVSFRRRYSVRL